MKISKSLDILSGVMNLGKLVAVNVFSTGNFNIISPFEGLIWYVEPQKIVAAGAYLGDALREEFWKMSKIIDYPEYEPNENFLGLGSQDTGGI